MSSSTEIERRLQALAATVTPERVQHIVRELAAAKGHRSSGEADAKGAGWRIIPLHDVVLRLQAEVGDAAAGLEPGVVYARLSVAAAEAVQRVPGMQFLAET